MTTSNTQEHTEVGSNNIDTDLNAMELTELTDMNTRIRSTFFTLNNPTEEDKSGMMSLILGKIDSRYLVYQLEIGESGTPHYQGFMYFYNTIKLKTVNAHMPRASFQKPRNIKACILYCKKERSRIEGPFEFGKMPEQGRRTDLETTAQRYLTLKVMDFVKEFPTEYVRYHKGLQALKQATLQHRDRNIPPTVRWFWGPSGTNKSRTAIEAHDDFYVKDGTCWWDGYEQQKAIIIDDFDGRWPYRDLLRLLDRYPYQGQIKGGYVKINSPFIYITCEHPPSHFWQDNELDQVTRRITEIRRFLGSVDVFAPSAIHERSQRDDARFALISGLGTVNNT